MYLCVVRSLYPASPVHSQCLPHGTASQPTQRAPLAVSVRYLLRLPDRMVSYRAAALWRRARALSRSCCGQSRPSRRSSIPATQLCDAQHTTLHHAAQHTTPHYTTPCSATLHHTTPHHAAPHYTTLYHAAPHYTTQRTIPASAAHHTTSHYIASHDIIHLCISPFDTACC
jgi:hypothetical protein